jgi:hypothetical protein
MNEQMEAFRAKAVRALDEMNHRIDSDKAAAVAERAAEQAARGIERARTALKSVKVSIAVVVALAAAIASVWDLMKLAGGLGANPWWGVAAGGAIDLGWVYLLLEVYSHRDDPAKALKPYRRTTWLLFLSALLNGVSGLLTGWHDGIGAMVLGIISVIMPVMLKTVITPLVLGGSLAGELLVTRAGRARVSVAYRDRHGRALEAFDAAYRLESERAEHSAQIELQRQRARFEAEREAIALGFQQTREELTRAAYEAAGLVGATGSDAANATPPVASATDAPALPAAGPVPLAADQLAAILASLGATQQQAVPVASAASVSEADAADLADMDGQEDAEPLEPPTLASLSKADAVRIALKRRPGYTARQVADLLGGYGVDVTDAYVRQVKARDAAAEMDTVVQLRSAN